jgi:4,5-dihydroxyphthalate decarboxylase
MRRLSFFRQLRFHEFDVSELSFSSYVLTLNLDDPPFIALPVFPSRFFRHQSMYINTKAGIKKPQDLAGKRIGIPEYQSTLSPPVRATYSPLNSHCRLK